MAHVGKTYPFFFHRDYSAPAAGFAKRLPWQWTFVAGVARPGPFNDWAGKTSLSSGPYFTNSDEWVNWDVPAPSGADPAQSLRIEYRLNHLTNWYDGRYLMLMSGVVAQEWSAGPVNVTLDTWVASQNLHVYSPPWPGGVPVLGTPGGLHASTWAELGVHQYPGHSLV